MFVTATPWQSRLQYWLCSKPRTLVKTSLKGKSQPSLQCWFLQLKYLSNKNCMSSHTYIQKYNNYLSNSNNKLYKRGLHVTSQVTWDTSGAVGEMPWTDCHGQYLLCFWLLQSSPSGQRHIVFRIPPVIDECWNEKLLIILMSTCFQQLCSLDH